MRFALACVRALSLSVLLAGCDRAPSPTANTSPSTQPSAEGSNVVKAAASTSASPAPSASGASAVAPRLTAVGAPKGSPTLELREYRFDTPSTAGSVWVVRIDLQHNELDLIQAKAPRPLQQIVADVGERDHVAINGGFYDRDGRPMGWVVRAGRELEPKTSSGGSGIFLVEADRARVVHRDAPLPRELPELALQSIDRLVDGGRSVVRPRPGLPRDARSAVVVRPDGAALFVTAFDARAAEDQGGGVIALNAQSTSTGLTLAEFAELLSAPPTQGGLGALTALNLDGGSSTSMSLRVGKTTRRLVAHEKTTNVLVASPR